MAAPARWKPAPSRRRRAFNWGWNTPRYAPGTTTDFTAVGQRLFDALKDKPGKKLIWFVWAGAANPLAKLADIDPGRYGIGFAAAGNILPALVACKRFPGLEDAAYYYDISTNPAMEGLSFDTPKGKMTFRKEDHQALQAMYAFKIRVDDKLAWGAPELTKEIGADEMDIPIRSKR